MDRILAELGCDIFPYKENGELTDEGAIAYDKLINIIYELNRIGVIKEDIDHCERLFDEIISVGY